MSVKITNVGTFNQRGENATLFHPYRDALSFSMDVSLSSDLVECPGAKFEAVFQVIDSLTNEVKFSDRWIAALPQEWGTSFSLCSGNNWGPADEYTTPKEWGLAIGQAHSDVFGFRAIFKFSPAEDEEHLSPLGEFDVAPIRWFRVAQVFTL